MNPTEINNTEPTPPTNDPTSIQPTAEEPIAQPSEQVAPVTPTNNIHTSPKRIKLLPIAALAVLLVAGAALAYFFLRPMSPQQLFDAALSNALKTSNFTQTNTLDGSKLTIKYDVSKPSDTRVQTSGNIGATGYTQITYAGYGTFNHTYIKFSSFKYGDVSAPQSALNKWFEVGNDSSQPLGPYFANVTGSDPSTAFFGDLIFGNFNAAQRNKLLDYLHKHTVYKFDPAKVTSETYKGQPVLVYKVVEDKDKLSDFNKLAGNLIGRPSDKLDQTLISLQPPQSSTVYISKKTKQFVHIVTDSDETLDYYDYGTTKLGSQPQAQITLAQFQDFILKSQQQ